MSDFDAAIYNLICGLKEASEDSGTDWLTCTRLLSKWDKDRGTDWYTSTKKREALKDE